jgi:RIP metalloprotease RseP
MVAELTYATPIQKALSGITHPANLLVYNFDVLGKLIGVSVQERTVEPVGGAVSGPVGIFKVFDEVLKIKDVKERVLQILNVTGIISISLAFFNILPIPALDGGRLFFIIVEAIIGRKVPQKYESIAHTVGFAVLMALIVVITFKDIRQFFF